MLHNVLSILAALVLLGLAGCAGPAAPAAGGPGSVTEAPLPSAEAPVANETSGAIAGTVVDDEQQPIPGVSILLLETQAETHSDAVGQFTFNGLEAKTYTLAAAKFGYEQVTRRVDVRLQETTTVTLALPTLVIPDEPYHVSVPHTSHMHLGYSMVTWPVQDIGYVNNSAVNEMLCDKCQFVLEFEARPKQVLTEGVWSEGTPATNAQVWVAHYRNRTGPSTNYAADSAFYISSGGQQNWSKATLEKWGGWNRMHVNVQGGLTNLNVEHKVTLWYTFAYVGYLPEKFTALPPP
jgi:hypothetical protein